MTRTAALKFAATALVVGTTLIGANPAIKEIGFASASDETNDAVVAAEAAAAAARALNADNSTTAIAEAERAVAASPREAAYRALLGQAYLQGGRLLSAETALGDALALDPQNGRATLSLALVQIALGKSALALTTLQETPAQIAETDRGLALALAGETAAAINLLEPAARVQGASGKTRQNLALAYALSGQWNRARAVAAQDVSPDQLNQRIAGWVRFTQPENSWDQVSTLLGISPVEDAGQPARLALAPVAVAAPALAAAEPEVTAEPQREELKVAVSDAGGSFRQITFAPRQEIVQPIPAALVRADRSPARTGVKPVAAVRYTEPAKGGRFVVQLGAYSSAERAEAAWNRAAGRFGVTGYQPVGDTYRLNGAAVHRVALGGFDARRDAERVCARVKARGGSCFVRASGNEAPPQWVQRAMGRLASR